MFVPQDHTLWTTEKGELLKSRASVMPELGAAQAGNVTGLDSF